MPGKIKFEALPPEEAIAFFRQKGYKIGFDHRDVWQEEHQGAFTVAKAMQIDLLRDIRTQVDEASDSGVPFEKFRTELQPRLVERGWWGRATMVDPQTGEAREVLLGSPRRLKVIYDTNLRTAHTEGQWQRIQETKADFPYLIYDANNSESPRLEHAAWDGLVLPVDDPFWRAHTPVKAWGCKCRVRQMTQRMLDRRGLSVGTSPKVPTYEYVNKRTCEQQVVPKGVDPAFNYPQGWRRRNLGKMLGEKLVEAPTGIGAVIGSAPSVVDRISDEYSSWFDALTSKQLLPQNARRVIGVIPPRAADYVKAQHQIDVASSAISLSDNELLHMWRDTKVRAGKSLPVEMLRTLPAQLANYRAILFDRDDPALVFVMDAANERLGKAIVRLNFSVRERDGGGKKRTIKTNAVRTTGIVQRGDLMAPRYELVEGEL